MSTGRNPTSNDCSAARAALFAERTEAKVASAKTSVPAAVAREEIVTQSITLANIRSGPGEHTWDDQRFGWVRMLI